MHMELFCVVSLLVALVPGPQTPAAKAQTPKSPAAGAAAVKGARTVELTAGDDMKYSLPKIEAKHGETLHVVLKSTGTIPKVAMAHNFVLLTLKADPTEFNKASATARDTDFVPPTLKSEVLASTKLAGPGETVDVTFKAPAAGTYTYMCTFPGHFAAGMRGQLVVK
jgi:azurin